MDTSKLVIRVLLTLKSKMGAPAYHVRILQKKLNLLLNLEAWHML